MAELDRRHRALPRDEACDARERIALVVVPQAEAMLGDAAARLDMGRLDANDAGAADRARGEMGEVPVVGEPVGCRILAHRRHHDAVADA